jgi:hypothetical protein
MISQHIPRDAKQPGALALARLVSIDAAHDAHEHVLREILSQIGAAGRESKVSAQRLPVLFEEHGREAIFALTGHTIHKRARR